MAEGDRDRWNEKWAERGRGTGHGSRIVALVEPWLPAGGRVLDIGGGGSTASLELARRGFAVTVCDVSDVGLAMAQQQALAEDLVVATVEADLDVEPLPPGPWDVITIANYLDRDVIPSVVGVLAPGGVVAMLIATETNLERNERPGPAHVVGVDELPSLVPGLEILHHSAEWRENDRHEAHLVARRPVQPASSTS